MASRAQLANRAVARKELGDAAADPASTAARLRAARQLVTRIVFPGTDLQIGLRLLSQRELEQAQGAAHVALKARGIDSGSPEKGHLDQLGAEVWAQLLCRALFESDEPGAALLFRTVDELKAEILPVELERLTDEYTALEDARRDRIDDYTGEEITRIVEAVKKKGETLLRDIVSNLPRSYRRSLAGQLASLPTSSSSNTSGDE